MAALQTSGASTKSSSLMTISTTYYSPPKFFFLSKFHVGLCLFEKSEVLFDALRSIRVPRKRSKIEKCGLFKSFYLKTNSNSYFHRLSIAIVSHHENFIFFFVVIFIRFVCSMTDHYLLPV